MPRGKRRDRNRWAAVAVLLPLSISACGVVAKAAPGPQVAPYVETTDANTGNLSTAISSHHLKAFTAAFILGDGCTPTWDDYEPISTATALNAVVLGAKAKGAAPIISFGGAAGTELATSCTDPAQLVNAYSTVIKKFGITRLDFDVEGAALTDAGTNTLRFNAIKTLEKTYLSLQVSLTVPVARGGLDAAGVSFLKSAKRVGARIDLVNIMTMDYGETLSDMGAVAVTSAKGTLPQLKKIWPAMTYKNLGITPMIGPNDTPGENFTLANAKTLVAFARTNGVGRLSFWSLNRDQTNLAFIDAFLK